MSKNWRMPVKPVRRNQRDFEYELSHRLMWCIFFSASFVFSVLYVLALFMHFVSLLVYYGYPYPLFSMMFFVLSGLVPFSLVWQCLWLAALAWALGFVRPAVRNHVCPPPPEHTWTHSFLFKCLAFFLNFFFFCLFLVSFWINKIIKRVSVVSDTLYWVNESLWFVYYLICNLF